MFGFPGETEEEFQDTYKFLKEINFYKMHIFKFSVREGTKAEKMENQVSPEEKEQRSKLLLELSDNNEREYLEKYIGKSVKVLFEEADEFGGYKGHTANYLMARVQSKENIINKILEVKVIGKENFILNCDYN